MEIFAKEIKVRQYKIDGLPYEVDFLLFRSCVLLFRN